MTHFHGIEAEPYRIHSEPFYLASGREVALFEAAYGARLPVMLKGPTGCGKTRFVRHMAWRLGLPLVTVACHEDLLSDAKGRGLYVTYPDRAADGLEPFSYISIEPRDGELHVHAFHLFPEECTILKTQSIFEVEPSRFAYGY